MKAYLANGFAMLGTVLRNRTFVLLLAALGFGALAVSGARGYIAERLELERDRLNPVRPMVEVVVAKHDLPPGTTIDANTMAVRSMPAEFVPGGAVRPDSFEELAGSRLMHPMRSGEPLLPTAVEHVREGVFSTRLRQGIRAMTIQVDEVNSVSGMLQPGDRIDLMFTVRPPANSGLSPSDEITAPLMQDLAVLATGSQVAASGDPASIGRPFTTITVEVTPEEAQRLIVAQRSGRLTATLRHPDDRAPVRAGALDVGTLLGLKREQRMAAQPTGPELIVGGRGVPLQASHTEGGPPALGAFRTEGNAPAGMTMEYSGLRAGGPQ
jgi:pilus assembly protein CpaB